MLKLYKYLIILSIIFFLSCSDDDAPTSPPDDDPVALNAKAGPNQETEVNETVTLDGTESTGPTGFTFSWTYEGEAPEEEINFQNKSSASSTFIPPAPGLYEFTLTINHEDSSDSDETTVLVGGAIKLGGTLTEDLELDNIQSDASLPDYIVTSDLIVPEGLMLSIVEDDVIIEFESGTGLKIEGGNLTNEIDEQDDSYLTEFRGNDWKGIWVNNGTININNSLIINAGASKFGDLEEPASVTLSGGFTELTGFSDNVFINSASYDLNVIDKFPENFASVKRNKFSYNIPIKAVITFMGFWHADHPNVMPETYDYIHLIPSGAETKDEINNVNAFSFTPNNSTFFIDGDFWAGSRIRMGQGNTILIKENSGILCDGDFSSIASISNQNILTGKDGKTWKGIAVLGSAGFVLFTTIENAGYGLIQIGSFRANEPAAYFELTPSASFFNNCKFINSGGYGYYNDNKAFVAGRFSSTLFKNSARAGIRINISSVNEFLRKDHNNVFEMRDEIPAVEVDESVLGIPFGSWYGLGGENYYLIDQDFNCQGEFSLYEGVYLKLSSGHSLIRPRNPEQRFLNIQGTQENPVIIDGEAGSSGSWGGMLLQGYYRIEHLIVRNGGEFILDEATEKANIISDFQESNPASCFFINSTVSNSSGWGIVVESFSVNFEFDDPEKNNTFQNNASGDILIK